MDRYLKDNEYGYTITESLEFALTRKALKAKFRELFSMGRGRKPNASSAFTEAEEEKLWQTGQLGMSDPKIGNFTMWFIVTKCMGMRPREENRQLIW